MAQWSQGISLRGKDGLGIIQEKGAPDASLVGANGQVYVDTDSAALDYYLYDASAQSWTKKGVLRGPMGLQGIDAQLFFGEGTPDASTYAGEGDALFIQDGTGQVFKFDKATGWQDAGFSLKGEPGIAGTAGAPGADGKDGIRGTQTYSGNGAPSSDLSSYSPPAAVGDYYYDMSGGPTLYKLGA